MKSDAGYRLLVIGGSAGSLAMLMKILPALDREMKLSVIVVLHRKQSDEETLVDLLKVKTTFDVKEVDDKDELIAGTVYLAPADYHVLVEKDFTLSLDTSEKVNFSRPSIDVTFESASEVFGEAMAGILLSGANADGAKGLALAKQLGSLVIIQDPATAEFPMMPQFAISSTQPDLLLNENNLSAMAHLLRGN